MTLQQSRLRTFGWTPAGTGSFTEDKLYVVQTNAKVIERCIQMTTDPGDLALDPNVRGRHDRLRCRAVGPAMDHRRHLARGFGAGPLPRDGSTPPLISTRRQPGGTGEGSRTNADCALRSRDWWRHPAGISYVIVCRTSLSSRLPTTPRSTLSGSGGRRRWSPPGRTEPRAWPHV